MSSEPAESLPPVWRDPHDVNSRERGNRHTARNRWEQRQAREAAALAELSPDHAARYRAIAEAGDDLMRAAWQDVLLAGKLESPLNRAEVDLLSAVEGLWRQELADGLDREALVAELLLEVADPAAISQRLHTTCGATAAQMVLARTAPAEYVRVVAGLASPGGKVTMWGGAPLYREPGTESPGQVRKGEAGGWLEDHRSDPARLFQSAGMELANGFANYDVVEDHHTDMQGFRLGRGLTQEGVSLLVGQLLGRKAETLLAADDREAAVERIAAAVAAGDLVPAGLAWNQRDEAGRVHAYHEVVVTAFDATRVYYMNPWGREEAMMRDDFAERLQAATVLGARLARAPKVLVGWLLVIVTLVLVLSAL